VIYINYLSYIHQPFVQSLCNEYLLWSIYINAAAITEHLLKYYKCDLTCYKNFPLLLAVYRNRIDLVKYLLENEVLVDFSIDNNYPFRICCVKGYLKLLEFLTSGNSYNYY
jgi:ankyrin repeat protein